MTIIRRDELIPARPGTDEQFLEAAQRQATPGAVQAKIESTCLLCRRPTKKWQWIRKATAKRWAHVACADTDDAATRLKARRDRLRAEKEART